ncbi:MAG TPA: hypothetical protein VD859_13140 [Nocardioides sp.]|nr:hypothetical protein [Nocardioides sp.]
MPTVIRTSVVPAPSALVWERVTNFAGVNHELMPFVRMVVPRHRRGTTVDDAPVGKRLGRFWMLYLGVLPLDYDDLTLTELVPGSHFQEVSTMLTMRRWEHRRELRPLGAGRTEVTDTVRFEPRLPLVGGAVAVLVGRLFSHRHRRLVGWFAERA